MKILALMTFDIFRFSLGAALEKLGHEVRYLGEFDASDLEKEILDFKPDMVIDMGWDVWQQDKYQDGELESIRDMIKKYQLFHLYFAEEDWLHFERWSKRYCKIMQPSFVLTRSPLTIRGYEEMGIPATFFDVGTNPDFHKPSAFNPDYACDVAVVATGNYTIGEIRYKSINDLVVPLIDKDFDVKIWGRDWDVLDWCYLNKKIPERMLKGKLPFTETPSVFSSAKICISIQTCNDQLSSRTLDILSSGGFLLTSNTKAVREKLLPGVNCAVTNSRDETLELISYYLQNEQERIQIASEGHKTAIEKFSYQKSLSTVWPEIEREWARNQPLQIRPSSQNLIKNGEFKEPLELDWVTHHAELVEDKGYKGSGSIRFMEGEENSFIQQKVTVEPYKNYLLSAWLAKEGEKTGVPINIIIYYYTKDHEIIEIGLYTSLFSTDMSDVSENKWFGFRAVTLNVPENADYAQILINKLPHKDSAPVLLSLCELREIVL